MVVRPENGAAKMFVEISAVTNASAKLYGVLVATSTRFFALIWGWPHPGIVDI